MYTAIPLDMWPSCSIQQCSLRILHFFFYVYKFYLKMIANISLRRRHRSVMIMEDIDVKSVCGKIAHTQEVIKVKAWTIEPHIKNMMFNCRMNRAYIVGVNSRSYD